jgi:PEP-CTERM motif
MKQIFKTGLVAAAVALSSSAFAAEQLNIEQSQFELMTTDSVMPSDGSWVSYNLNGKRGGDLAIEFDTTVPSIGSFASYCLDLSAVLNTPGMYNYSTQQVDSVARLFTVAGFNGNDWANDGVTGTESSALQVAIWEVMHDSLATANLDTGNLFFTSINSTVKSQAIDFLSAAAALNPGQYSADVRVFTPVDGFASQPLVTTVPEPSTYAMLAACLGIVGLVARRKSA